MSDGSTGKGIQIKRAGNTIGEIVSHGRKKTVAAIDFSNYDSLAKEFRPGLVDNGEFNFEMNFLGADTEQQALEDDADDGTISEYEIVLNDHDSDPSTFTFEAFVKSFDVTNGGVDEKVSASVSLQITGTVERHYRP